MHNISVLLFIIESCINNNEKEETQTPSQGHTTAKIESAGDGHYLYLQTQFGEDRWTQFWVLKKC